MPLIGNIDDLKWDYDPEVSAAGRSPIRINTPHLEVRIIVLKPGQFPPYHRHHAEMDEGYLIYRGRGLMNADGEVFEVGAGDVLLGKRGGFHNMKNIGGEDLIEFNFRGGKMPSGNIKPDGDGAPADPDLEKPGAAEARNKYVKGTLKSLARKFDPETVKKKGLPKVFTTEHLDLRIISFAPGAQPELHRHQSNMDEAGLILKGRAFYHIDGDEFEAGEGDLIHLPGGSWHYIKNIGGDELILFIMQGGNLPSATDWKK